MACKRRGPRSLYKGRYIIAFYDKFDSDFLYFFNNVREILQFQGKEITRKAINLLNVEIYRGLKSPSHLINFLTGEWMKIYIIDESEDEENE